MNRPDRTDSVGAFVATQYPIQGDAGSEQNGHASLRRHHLKRRRDRMLKRIIRSSKTPHKQRDKVISNQKDDKGCSSIDR